MTTLLNKESAIRFSKFVVFYCLLFAPVFTAAVMVFNWHGIHVQTEIIIFFGTAFLGHLITLAWVTVTKEKCNCIENQIHYEGGNN